MTTALEAESAVVQRFLAEWSAVTPVVVEAEKYTPRRGIPWARISVRQTDSRQGTLGPSGARRFRRMGEVKVQLFTPAAGGTARGAELGHMARAIFEAKTVDGMWFFAGRVEQVGIDGEWLMHLVSCPFEYQEIK